jgi:hypothetical protein
MLHLLQETDLTEEQRDYSDTMQRSSDLLLRIIDDILDFRYFFSFFFFFPSIFINQ